MIRFEDEVKILFVNREGQKADITINVKQLLENTIDDFYEWISD